MKLPNWVDEQLSNDLPILRSRGEGQHLEFKEMFPQNTRDLAKEIAAFATSNQGTILIGVSDSGDLKGINGAEDQKERDSILKRLEGICRGTVKPAITPIAKFAYENELVVLVINVPHGKQPVYYSGNTPYVRHLTESRPAEPHEVIDLISEYIINRGIGGNESGDELRSGFYSDLARTIGDTLIYADQVDERNVNPWLDQWRSAFGYAAEELRELAAQSLAIEDSLDEELRDIANSLDEVFKFRLTLGCGPELDKLVNKAKEKMELIKGSKIDSIVLSQESINLIKTTVITTTRQLRDLVARSNDLVESGNIEELQEDASELGHDILRVAKYNISNLGEGVKESLIDVGRSLHLIETMRISMDGGASIRAIVDKVAQSSDELETIIKDM